MNYEDALREWGARNLEKDNKGLVIDRSTVQVDMEFDPGYACCGGRDPDCYCSFAESPSADVTITGRREGVKKGQTFTYRIGCYEFDFATILKEIIIAGGGTLSS